MHDLFPELDLDEFEEQQPSDKPPSKGTRIPQEDVAGNANEALYNQHLTALKEMPRSVQAMQLRHIYRN